MLLLGSVGALFLPERWTSRLVNLVQWVVPFQQAAQTAVDAISSEDLLAYADGAAREGTALEHVNAALAARVDELEEQVRILTATRLWDAGGRRLGARGRLIPARVIGQDIAPWRSSRLLTAGTRHGVSDGAAVVSKHFTVDRGLDGGVQSGLAVLLGEVLIGVVEQSATHTCRMKLLSDVSVQMKVRIGRRVGERFELLDRYFWLSGVGDGRMEIRDVEKRDIDAALIAVGNIVLSDPQSESLPAALTIGHVGEIRVDRDNPLFAILTIHGVLPEDALRQVYIYDPRAEAP